MAITNHDRVGKAVELLRAGLAPFVEREFKNAYKDQALTEARRLLPADDRLNGNRALEKWDAAVLLKVMWDAWNDVFGRTLGRAERSLVQELRDTRNRWAHQEAFTSDDAYRALDSAEEQAVITTGGTGIARRDVTYEAVTALFDKALDGFGELFRVLSFEEIGAAAMLSRACAGVARGRIVISLPGSVAAVRLAMDKLVGPELAHMVREAGR